MPDILLYVYYGTGPNYDAFTVDAHEENLSFEDSFLC